MKKMTSEEALRRINEDPDFICVKRYGYSLKELLEKFPEGTPDKLIARALLIPEEQFGEVWEDLLNRLRSKISGI